MKKTLVVAVGVAWLMSPVYAARPLQTDDAGVLPRAACELEGGHQRQRAGGARLSQTDLQWGCGIGWNTQLGVGVSRADDVGGRQTGVLLGGKHALWPGRTIGGNGAGLALAWQLDATRPRGSSWQHAGREFRLIGTRPLNDSLIVHANLGAAYDAVERRSSTVWGLALEHTGLAAVQGMAPMIELYGDDREPASWSLGLRYAALSDKLFIDAAYGRQFSRQRPSLLTIGFTLAY